MKHTKNWKGLYWMAVTPDKFELPLAVGESAGELAAMLGRSAGDISFLASRECDGSRCGFKIVKVMDPEYTQGPSTYVKVAERRLLA